MDNPQTELNYELLKAAVSLDCARMDALIDQGADVNFRPPGRQPVLHLLCQFSRKCKYESVNAIRVLVRRGADLNVRTRGCTPLHWACIHVCLEKIKVLVEECGANVHEVTRTGFTLLHIACENPCSKDRFHRFDFNIVKYLIVEQGVDVNAKTQNGFTALHLACGKGRVNTVRFLLAAGANILAKNNREQSCVDFALNLGPGRIRRYLKLGRILQNTIDLVKACQEQDEARVEFLCWQDVFVHVYIPGEANESLFSFVWRRNLFRAMVALVHKGADVSLSTNDKGKAINEKVRHWHVSLVQHVKENNIPL